jgi:cell division protease FtsH
MLFILLLSLLSLSYSFIQPNAQSKSLFFSNNVKMMNSELIETANTLISRGTLGTPWSLNDLFINLDNSNVEMASILNNMNTVVALDKNFGDVITDDNLHAIKTLPHLTDTIIDAFVKNNINFDILNYEPHGLFSYIPGPFQFFMIYLLFLFVINFIRFRYGASMSSNSPMNFVSSILDKDSEIINPKDINVTFADVAGCDEAKYELVEVIDFLKNSTRFDKAGAIIPKGVLLEGPPGTGKTLLARATAGEAGVSFISASGSQFIEMFVGVGASRVRKLFDLAVKNKPCIIFIDEIDAIGQQRGSGLAGGNDEREQTLNQLLTNMDGFSKSSGIIVMAATNRADILDNALTRPGRFDRKVNINLPDSIGRRKIMKVHFKNKLLDETIDLNGMVELTSGFSGADIANLANEAAILSIRYNETCITDKCLMDAFEKMTIGLPKKTDMREENIKQLVAYHEAGHTLTALLFEEFFDIRKVTINANNNGAGGYTLFTPKERYSGFPTKKFMLANIIVALGGRAAEVLLYKRENTSQHNYDDESLFPNICDLYVTTGASNDLKQANSIARKFVSMFGLGNSVGLYDSGDTAQSFLGRELSTSSNKISDTTRNKIDEEVEELVKKSFELAVKILEKNEKSLHTVSNMLLNSKTVDGPYLKKIEVKF